jgi:hypothetical protein
MDIVIGCTHHYDRDALRAGRNRGTLVKIFVSYTAKDLKWAKWIVWILENTDPRHECVAQFKSFVPGQDFVREMRRQLQDADIVLSVLSSAYLESDWCEQEMSAAIGGNAGAGKLLPVRVQPCDLPDFDRHRIYVDLVGVRRADAAKAVREGVAAYIDFKHKSAKSAQPRTLPRFPGAENAEAKTAIAARSSLKVLFLGSDVRGLDPKGQLRNIKAEIRKASHPRSIKFVEQTNIRVAQFIQALNVYEADIIHISGKQVGGDILLKSRGGKLTTISDKALAGVIRSLDRKPVLVVLDTCSSLSCAEALLGAVQCSIGVAGDTYEEHAITFYGAFYRAIASGRSLKHAYATARVETVAEWNTPDEEIPVLRCAPGLKAASIVLVAPSSRPVRVRA